MKRWWQVLSTHTQILLSLLYINQTTHEMLICENKRQKTRSVRQNDDEKVSRVYNHNAHFQARLGAWAKRLRRFNCSITHHKTISEKKRISPRNDLYLSPRTFVEVHFKDDDFNKLSIGIGRAVLAHSHLQNTIFGVRVGN